MRFSSILFRFSGGGGGTVKSTCEETHGGISYVRDSHYGMCMISHKEQWYKDEVVLVSYSYQLPKLQSGITCSYSQHFPFPLLQSPTNHTIPSILFQALKLPQARGTTKVRLQR